VINIPLREPEEIASAIRRVMVDYRGQKPVLACFMMSGVSSLDMRYGEDSILPVYMFPEDAVQSLALAWPYARYRQRTEGAVPEFRDIDEDGARRFLHAHPARQGWLAPEAAVGLLRNYGITVADTRAAYSPEEAVEAARAIGFPMAMKLRSMSITHKTDVGGISLDLQNEEAVRSAYAAIRDRMTAAGYEDAMEGVIVQPMARGGQEVIIGMSQDPVFGPLLMVGMGGVQVELIKDVAFSLHPLRDSDPDYMLSQLRSLPLLTGWRGNAPKDLAALKEVLLRFSALVDDFPEIAEMEINPLMVFDKGQGCMVVDARIRMKGPV
jgi:acyl-CoA synthetase (NDP forming)